MTEVIEITAEIEGYGHPRSLSPAPDWARVFDAGFSDQAPDPVLQLERARLLNVLMQAGKKIVFIDEAPMVEGKTIHTFTARGQAHFCNSYRICFGRACSLEEMLEGLRVMAGIEHPVVFDFDHGNGDIIIRARSPQGRKII